MSRLIIAFSAADATAAAAAATAAAFDPLLKIFSTAVNSLKQKNFILKLLVRAKKGFPAHSLACLKQRTLFSFMALLSKRNFFYSSHSDIFFLLLTLDCHCLPHYLTNLLRPVPVPL